MQTNRHLLPLFFSLFCIAFLPMNPDCQINPEFSSANIYRDIESIGVVGSVMYVAAHPDDENTRLISWLSNEKLVRTAYLSMTRGDGGQNLVGSEISELLGVIRTQELVQARRIDGGEQWFTRANDFGYSKSPEETLEFWGSQEILADVVWAIRNFKPDVIITRFPHEHLPGNHGHHTASAMLAIEAFDLSGDPSAFPEQLTYVKTWQPKHLFFNTSWWFYGSRENFEEQAKADHLLEVETGAYDPLTGYSDNEISALSRSMHKSQGFGISSARGKTSEYFKYMKGEANPAEIKGLFDGVDMTWSRVDGGAHIQEQIDALLSSFNFTAPESSIEKLLSLRTAIQSLKPNPWKNQKIAKLDEIIRQCLGLFMEASTPSAIYAPGDSLTFDLEITLRREGEVILTSIGLPFKKDPVIGDNKLDFNEQFTRDFTVVVPDNITYSDPYWLRQPWLTGRYTVTDYSLLGKPESPEPVKVALTFDIQGTSMQYELPLHYTTTDPVAGELTRPLEVLPRAFLSLNKTMLLFTGEEAQLVTVILEARTPIKGGKVRLEAGEGWQIHPPFFEVDAIEKGRDVRYVFRMTSPEKTGQSTLTPVFTDASGREHTKGLKEIDYAHIDHQAILLPAEAKLLKIDLEKKGERIAYVQGAGDDIPESLEQIGYQVDILEVGDLSQSTLEKYDALLLGIRAFNTLDKLANRESSLFNYVEQGGTLIVQYNTRHNLVTEKIAPYAMQLSRNRVTDEGSEVEILLPDHPVMQSPNQITKEDFEGWVQERGLYFPGQWDPAFEAILGMNDPGEEQLKGALLVAKYGKGYYVYTPLSWFRQLPAGVPGAYRIMANLISLGQMEKS